MCALNFQPILFSVLMLRIALSATLALSSPLKILLLYFHALPAPYLEQATILIHRPKIGSLYF